MFEAIKYVLLEHFNSAGRIWDIAREVARRQVVGTSFGMGWIFFRDVVHFLTFTLVRYLLAGSRLVDGIPFIAYLLVGFVTWFFISDVVNTSSRSIKGNKAIINSFSFPTSVLPTIDVVAVFIRRAFSISFIFLVAWGYGYTPLFKPWLFIYYFFAMFMMMIAFNFVFSAINAISLDFSQLYESLTRVLIYTVPLLWGFDQVARIGWAVTGLKINPFAYILIGIRSAILGGTPNTLEYTIYFWSWFLVLFSVGSFMQFKLRKYYADFI